MERIQLAIHDAAYRDALRGKLRACQPDEVACVDQPDLRERGVIVLDTVHLRQLGPSLERPERVVLVSHPGKGQSPAAMRLAWEAGVHAVVDEQDPLDTAVLAILSARLRAARQFRKGDKR